MKFRKSSTITLPVDFGELGEVLVELSYYYFPPVRGKIFGPVDACYPPEPFEIELVDVHCDLLTEQGHKLLRNWVEDNAHCVVTKILEQEGQQAEEFLLLRE